MIHADPYSGASKGKVERMNRTVKDLWMSRQDFKTFKSLQEVNESLSVFINKYNYETKHTAIDNITPFERYQLDLDKIKRLDAQTLNTRFLMEKEVKVYSDSTLRLNNTLYLVPSKYSIERKLTIKYTPNFSEVYINDKDELIPINVIDLHANANV